TRHEPETRTHRGSQRAVNVLLSRAEVRKNRHRAMGAAPHEGTGDSAWPSWTGRTRVTIACYSPERPYLEVMPLASTTDGEVPVPTLPCRVWKDGRPWLFGALAALAAAPAFAAGNDPGRYTMAPT